MDALERGDVDALVAMLSEEAAWSMPPLPGWYRGEEAIAAFLAEYPCRERWRHVPSHANGQVAVGCYMWDASARPTPLPCSTCSRCGARGSPR